jgi:hypothetical protein
MSNVRIPSMAKFKNRKVHVMYQKGMPSLEDYHMVCLSWYAPQVIDQIKRFPKDRTTICCNEPCEVEFVKNQGYRTILCPENSIRTPVDVFVPQQQDKKYDAIYNAGMVRYKRHELARRIKNIALIYYQRNKEYEKQLKRMWKRECWLNELGGSYKRLSQSEVTSEINQSHVGLCLSSLEGSNAASAEYLLCGIPVVSTKNKGGRDSYYEQEYAMTVPPNQFAIHEAVQEMMSRDLDPYDIRNSVLKKIDTHKEKFVEEVMREAGEFNWSAFKKIPKM